MPDARPTVPAPPLLPTRHADVWLAATRHPFLDGVRDGSLPSHAFRTWLAQDALFVADLLRFQARLLARAPRSGQAVLAGGALALVEELAWFDDLAARRGLDLGAAPLPATRAYSALLGRMDAAPYPDALRCLWAVERVYLDAWTTALPGAADHAELVEHWTTPAFAEYVDRLELLARDAGGTDDALLVAVLHQEVDFWDEALDGAA